MHDDWVVFNMGGGGGGGGGGRGGNHTSHFDVPAFRGGSRVGLEVRAVFQIRRRYCLHTQIAGRRRWQSGLFDSTLSNPDSECVYSLWEHPHNLILPACPAILF